MLALIITLIRLSPQIGAYLNAILGNPEKREKTIRALEDASAAFSEIFGKVLTIEDEEARATYAQLGRIPPSRLVSETLFYVRVLKYAERLPEDLEVDSFLELTKYALVGYVERATGHYQPSVTTKGTAALESRP